MGTLALVTMTNMAYADVDMTAMHKQLNIMNNIVRTSLNEVGAESGYGIGQLESLYLAGQGVVFSMQTSSHSRYSGSHPFRISAPHVPVAPVPPVASVIEQEVVAEVEAQEMVMRTLETSAMNYEQAIEAMEQAREIAREIREQQRDVTYDLRDVEREIRDKRYQEKHLAKDKDALKFLLIDLSTYYVKDGDNREYNVIEPPLGLMALLSYINEQDFANKINDKMIKSFIDFNSNDELVNLIKDFNPDVIGIRAMTFYRKFFHDAIAHVRKNGITKPIIVGGPYPTASYTVVLNLHKY